MLWMRITRLPLVARHTARLASWLAVSLAMAAVPAGVTASSTTDVTFSVPQAESSRPTQLTHLALTALLYPHGDEESRLEGDTFMLPVPLPWPPGADQARSWDLEVPSGAPLFALAAVAPARVGLVPAVAIDVDGVPLSLSDVATVHGAYLPDLQGGQEYAALASVIPPLEPGRHVITVSCSACVPAAPAGNAWLSTVNAGPRTYRLNVQPPPASVQLPGSSALDSAGPPPSAPAWPQEPPGLAASTGLGDRSISLRASMVLSEVGSGASERVAVTALGSAQARATDTSLVSGAAGGSVLERAFFSPALGREMPYRIYLPPGYGGAPEHGQAAIRRYPVVYLLHGLGGSQKQWSTFGFVAELERQIAAAGTPLIVVMPTGRAGYWVDHADGGPQWGEYVARDLVAHIDGTYLTEARQEARAIGGVSMGGHGALQLTLNHPGVFDVVGAHSPALRTRDQAPPLLGGALGGEAAGAGPEAYAARDPISLIRHAPAGPAPVRALWLDIGQQDRWVPRVLELRAAIQQQGWGHVWRPEAGNHDLAYWQRRLPDYVRFYREAFAEAGW
jgi:S-formylglutathione hydrolase FrmB